MTKILLTSFAVCLLLSASTMNGESKNMADYTLRIRIFSKDATNFYYMRNVQESKGDGRADLFEGDDVIGVDFNYSCDQKFKTSFGYETYPARWKKPGQVLTVLLPVFGKANTYFPCNFNTAVRDTVYVRRNGSLLDEPPAKYKLWMAKHEYDPVHGKNIPTDLSAKEKSEAEGPAPATAPAAAPTPTAAAK